jgi:hypothetical protein
VKVVWPGKVMVASTVSKAAAKPRVTMARLMPRSRSAGRPMATPTGTAARPPISIQTMRPPGASSTLSQPVTQAPTPAKDI